MLAFIQGELYKVLHRKYIYIFILILSIIFVGGSMYVLKGNILPATVPLTQHFVLQNGNFIALGVLVLLMLVLPILTEEYKYNTLKNLVTLNLSKAQIYLGKLFVQTSIMLILAVVFITEFVFVLQAIPSGESAIGKLLLEFILKIICTIPCYIATIVILNLMAILLKNAIVICLVYYYGYIQIYMILMFTCGNISSDMVRIILMPGQIQFFFLNKFTMYNCLLTIVTGIFHLAIAVALLLRTVKIMENKE